jgi:hypothetical protein
MNNSNQNQYDRILGKYTMLLLAAIAAVPIWLAINSFVSTIHVHEEEAVATAATGCFLASVFLGRHFARLLSLRIKTISNGLLIALSVIVAGSTIGLFLHAEFPIEGHDALNLLLYWLPFLLMGVALGMLIKLGREISEKQLRHAQTLAAHSKSELNLLQSQLSPHFLFNTLNNLYGLSITEHERIPALLLKLSDLLRYSVYEAGEIFVPLKDELIYINNYIEFEQIRIGDRLELTTKFEQITSPEIKIAPMLLIVFIENAFKHSKNTADEKIYISIELKIWENLILFSIKNSHDKTQEETSLTNKHSGFGLASVYKRLELLYPNEHELNIESNQKSYNLTLRLKSK